LFLATVWIIAPPRQLPACDGQERAADQKASQH
jgi:hypothetical protein